MLVFIVRKIKATRRHLASVMFALLLAAVAVGAFVPGLTAVADVRPEEDNGFLPYNTTSLVKHNTDGTRTMRIFSEPVNYRDEDSGRWQPIDTTIVQIGDVYGVETGLYEAYFYADHVEMVRAGGSRVQTFFEGVNAPGYDGDMALSVEGNKATYSGAVDVEYVYTNTGLKQNVVLFERPLVTGDSFIVNTKLVFDQPVYAASKHFITSEGVEFRNAQGEVFYRLPRPYSFELNNPENQVDSAYEITVDGNVVLVALKTPVEWLESAAYPVVIDPTSTYYSTDTMDGYITYSGSGDPLPYASTDTAGTALNVGRYRQGASGSLYRGFVSFDTSAIPDGDTVISATLGLKTTSKGKGSGGNLTLSVDFNALVYRVNYGTSLGSEDGDVYQTGTLEGTILATANWAANTFFTLAVGQTAINKAGTTQYEIKSDVETISGNIKSWLELQSSDTTGTSSDPYLQVTYGTVTWVSYQDAAHTTEQNSFTGELRTVYRYGAGFTASTGYTVAYFDGDDSLELSDSVSSDGSGNLSSQANFESLGATAGTWRAVVYENSVGSPPSTYTASDPNSIIEDTFSVNASAIPEFSTVLASIVVPALCAAAYWYFRKRQNVGAVREPPASGR